MLRDILPAKHRKTAYALYAVIGVILGAIQVGYGAAETATPAALTVALAVYAFLGGAIGITAGAHTDQPRCRDLYLEQED